MKKFMPLFFCLLHSTNAMESLANTQPTTEQLKLLFGKKKRSTKARCFTETQKFSEQTHLLAARLEIATNHLERKILETELTLARVQLVLATRREQNESPTSPDFTTGVSTLKKLETKLLKLKSRAVGTPPALERAVSYEPTTTTTAEQEQSEDELAGFTTTTTPRPQGASRLGRQVQSCPDTYQPKLLFPPTRPDTPALFALLHTS
jgi:hypothetical protein